MSPQRSFGCAAYFVLIGSVLEVAKEMLTAAKLADVGLR
jgi:hypothetical protein